MSAWIEHVKTYAKEHNIKYRDALKEASASYKGNKKGEANETTKKTVEIQVEPVKEALPEPKKFVRKQRAKC